MLAPEALEAPGANAPFTMDPNNLELEGGIYLGKILLGDLSDLLVGRRMGGGGKSDSGGSAEQQEKHQRSLPWGWRKSAGALRCAPARHVTSVQE